MAWIKRNTTALAGLGTGAVVALMAILLGSVIATGEGIGNTPTPPEQVYFF